MLLYHLGIGAGSRPGDNLSPDALRYTLDGPALQVLPSFGIVAPTFHETDPPPLDLPGCDINLAQVVHGAQSISVTGPLPTSGTRDPAHPDHRRLGQGHGRGDLAGGRGHVAESGEELWTVRSSIFVKGEGGWGGDRGSSARSSCPTRAPDADTTYDVTPQQALLYRLCGDRNPLHADPDFAQGGRLPGADPARAVLLRHRAAHPHRLPARRRRDRGSAASPRGSPAWCSPGETIRVRGWRDGDRIVASATIAGGDRDGVAGARRLRAQPGLTDGSVTSAVAAP